ncbi:MAG: hypothetical protein FJ033_14075 [Chloroflexi bacterium]|nr:hypothetical protein [Chloroflexota bacterium]
MPLARATMLTYRFESVETPAAATYGNVYYFAATVLGEVTYWGVASHGQDFRFPHRDAPTKGCEE